eukprot:scaffold29206_cov30-Attheya_sp.AAC.2
MSLSSICLGPRITIPLVRGYIKYVCRMVRLPWTWLDLLMTSDKLETPPRKHGKRVDEWPAALTTWECKMRLAKDGTDRKLQVQVRGQDQL